MRDDSIYLYHIVDAIDQATAYLADMDEAAFLANRLVQDGVIRQIEIIGEATKQLAPALREQHASIPWRDLAGMRDKLIHQYFGVDMATVWLTATEDLPILRSQVMAVLDGLLADSRKG